jgi:hypothetical protein
LVVPTPKNKKNGFKKYFTQKQTKPKFLMHLAGADKMGLRVDPFSTRGDL